MASLWLALQFDCGPGSLCEKAMRLGRGQRAVEFKSSCAQSFWSYLPLHDAWAAMRCCWSVLPLPKLNFMAKSDRDFVVACYDGQVEAVTLMLKSGQFDGNTSTSGQSALCAAAAGVRGGRPQSDEIKVRLIRLLCAHGADPNRFNWRFAVSEAQRCLRADGVETHEIHTRQAKMVSLTLRDPERLRGRGDGIVGPGRRRGCALRRGHAPRARFLRRSSLSYDRI